MDKMWFAPKRYGYGAGLPIAWQGWVLFAVYVALLGLVEWFALNKLHGNAQIYTLLVGILAPTALLVWIAAAKTKGGWRWRWGDDD